MIFNAIRTKIKAMMSCLLCYDDYVSLAKLKNIDNLADRLKKFYSYDKFINDLDNRNLNRRNIEQKLFLVLRNDFEKIYSFVFDHDLKKYLSAFFLRDEIFILKLIMCRIYDKRNFDLNYDYNLSVLDLIISNKIKIDIDKLKKSDSLEKFISNLRGTEFYDLLNESYEQTHNLFELETKLDLYYYINLNRYIKKYLYGNDKDIMLKINAAQIDLINIVWLYRIKKYYNLEANKIFCYLVPNKYKLSTKEISGIINANNKKEFDKIIYNSAYGYLFKEKKDKDLSVEHVLNNYLSRAYYKAYVNNDNNISCVVYYIYLKELEINNITSVIEGVRYGLEPQKIISYLYIVK